MSQNVTDIVYDACNSENEDSKSPSDQRKFHLIYSNVCIKAWPLVPHINISRTGQKRRQRARKENDDDGHNERFSM